MYKRILLLTVVTAAHIMHGAANDEIVTTITQRFQRAAAEKNIAEAIIQLQSLKSNKANESDLYALAIKLDRPTDDKQLGDILNCFQRQTRNWINLNRTRVWEKLRLRHGSEQAQEQQITPLNNPAITEPYSHSDVESPTHELSCNDGSIEEQHCTTIDYNALTSSNSDQDGINFKPALRLSLLESSPPSTPECAKENPADPALLSDEE